MFLYEQLCLGYFVCLGAGALLTRVPTRRIASAILACGTAAVIVLFVSRAPIQVRTWAPHVYLIAAYWLPALLVSGETARFQTWPRAHDRRHQLPALPAWLRSLSELAYLLCYPLLPAALGLVLMFGAVQAFERFWLSVLLSAFSCYATLPWLVSRPPRGHAGDASSPHRIGRINRRVLAGVSHGFNTFPSGHVAVSVAAALSVLMVWLPGGVFLLATAAGIAVGAIAGRYHYTTDVWLGGLVGVLGWLIGSAA
jgi:hypothetical protein